MIGQMIAAVGSPTMLRSCHCSAKRRRGRQSSSFSRFLSSMPIPLGQLPSSASSSVVTMCASMSSVYPVVTAVPFVPLSTVTPVEPDHKRHCLEDHKERECTMRELED